MHDLEEITAVDELESALTELTARVLLREVRRDLEQPEDQPADVRRLASMYGLYKDLSDMRTKNEKERLSLVVSWASDSIEDAAI